MEDVLNSVLKTEYSTYTYNIEKATEIINCCPNIVDVSSVSSWVQNQILVRKGRQDRKLAPSKNKGFCCCLQW